MTEFIGSDYEIKEELRRTPWISVYRVRNRTTGRQGLLKWLNPEFRDDHELVGRLLRETELGGMVRHPNVARIIDHGVEDGRPFLVVEWIDGQDLETELAEVGPFPPRRVYRLALELLEALETIHRAGIIHRDISPSNIRVAEDSSVMITDFGLATQILDDRLTLPGTVMGTPGYLSPEQAAARETDARSDLFSTGVVIYEALTGNKLFREVDLLSTLRQIRQKEIPQLDDLEYGLSPGFGEWLQRLLAKDPQERWASAKEAREALYKLLLEDHSIQESPLPEQSEVRKPAKWFIVLPILVGLFVVFLVFQYWHGTFAPTVHPPGMMIDNRNVLQKPVYQARVVDRHRYKDTTVDQPKISREPAFRLQSPLAEEGQNDHSQTNKTIRPALAANESELILRTLPWAEVFLNGNRMGITPGLPPISLKPGRIKLQLRNPDFPTLSFDTLLRGGEYLDLTVNLEEYVGVVLVKATPWADVRIGRKKYGRTPMNRPIYLLPGAYRIEFSDGEGTILEKRFRIDRKRMIHFSADMMQKRIDYKIEINKTAGS